MESQQEKSLKVNVASNEEALINLFMWQRFSVTLQNRDKFLSVQPNKFFDVYGNLNQNEMLAFIYSQPIEEVSSNRAASPAFNDVARLQHHRI